MRHPPLIRALRLASPRCVPLHHATAGWRYNASGSIKPLKTTPFIPIGTLIVTTRALQKPGFSYSPWFLIGLITISTGCYRETIPMLQVIQGRSMGTTYSVKFTADQSSPILLTVSKRVEDELKSINEHMSTYIKSSEISRFNQSASTEWFAVSTDTAQVVSLALDISAATHGAFDVTVGGLVELWGFGAANRPTTVPTEEQIQQLLGSAGYQRLHVRIDPPALQKDAPELIVDLSGIAKGYAVDRIAEVLQDSAINDFFIEIGGEVLTRGKRLDGRAWQVGIELPDATRRALYGSLELSGAAMATSGDYRNSYELDGQRYSHTIDPRTGRPSQHELASATVIDNSCAKADAIATGIMALGYEEGLRTSNEMGWKVFLIRRDAVDLNADLNPGPNVGLNAGLSTGASAAFEAGFKVEVAK